MGHGFNPHISQVISFTPGQRPAEVTGRKTRKIGIHLCNVHNTETVAARPGRGNALKMLAVSHDKA
jgi:hypothetical protein